jgi:hypothetical protein
MSLGLSVLFLLSALGFVVAELSGGVWDTRPVSLSGKVTMDGRPLEKGIIRISSKDQDHPTGDAASIRDGKYAIDASQALVPGTYAVRISGLVDANGMPLTNPSVEESIPARYNRETKIEIELKEPGRYRFDFDLKH